VDSARFLSASDIATVSTAVTSSNQVNLLMRNNGNLTIGADMDSLGQLQVGNTGNTPGYGTFIRQTAGIVDAVNLFLGTDDVNGGLYELSGNAWLRLKGSLTSGANGKIALIGNDAALRVGNGGDEDFQMNSTAVLEFTLDADGIGSVEVQDLFSVDETNAILVVDASAYEGDAATFDLVTYATNSGMFASNNVTVTGLKSWTLGFETNRMVLDAVPYGPGDTLVIGQDDFDAVGVYSNRVIKGGANTEPGTTWAVVSRDNIEYPGMIDTSVAAGGVVPSDPADLLGFLGTNKTDYIFGMYRGGTNRTLVYTFDITGYTNLNVAMDWATSGNILDKDVSMSYSIDGAEPVTNFAIGRSTADWIETLDSGAARTNANSAAVWVNGVSTNSLTDEFQTYNAMIDGTGSVLTLTFVMGSQVGAYGGMGLDNLKLYGTIPGTAPLPEIGNMSISTLPGGTQVVLSWNTGIGYTYGLQAKSGLEFGTWNNIATNIIATGSEVSVTNSILSAAEFYRAYLEE
jgi:hypothetical protein